MIRKLNNKGMALVLTLMVLSIVTAIVVEFTYGVYVNTTFLYNWQSSQWLTMSSNSGVSLSARLISEATKKNYTYPGYIDLPPTDPFGDGKMDVSLRIEDESGKFNLNKIVYDNGDVNPKKYAALKIILEHVKLDPENADRMVDWIDKDSIPSAANSEEGVKNAPMDSIEEMVLIPGIQDDAYDKLSPYVTVHGKGVININAAEVPVIMSLSGLIEKEIDDEMAQRVIDYRDNTPFKQNGEISSVAGFDQMVIPLQGHIAVKGVAFKVIVTATSSDGIKRIIECVMDDKQKILYWKEI